MKNVTEWKDPEKTLWGFHVHQELPEEDFARSLVIQSACKNFLAERGVSVDFEDALRAGYGPHINPMWELRVETQKRNLFEHMGAMISFLAVNRRDLPAYIHPLMHDESLPEIEALKQEGETNQVNALWFGRRVAQNQDFFFNPPLTEEGRIVDTRSERVLLDTEKSALRDQGHEEFGAITFQNPSDVILRGFHVHMDYNEDEKALAEEVFDHFMFYLLGRGLRPTSTRQYAPKENGPHELGGWEVKFETRDAKVLETIGIAVAWLMCNRQGISVFFHPVSWEEGDNEEEINAHENYSFFLGFLPALDLDFFRH